MQRTAGEFGDLVHVLLDNCGEIFVLLVGGFAALEVNVGILSSHLGVGSFRTESAIAETFDVLHVHEGLHIIIAEQFDFLIFVRSTEI